MHDYEIISATTEGSVSVRVTSYDHLRRPSSKVHQITIEALELAASHPSEDLVEVYRPLAKAARAAISEAKAKAKAEAERQRRGSIARCPEHRPEFSSEARRFTGPVGRDENPIAHGGITLVELCRCGAVRQSNQNGLHREVSPWG